MLSCTPWRLKLVCSASGGKALTGTEGHVATLLRVLSDEFNVKATGEPI
jgi:hypothetical protein